MYKCQGREIRESDKDVTVNKKQWYYTENIKPSKLKLKIKMRKECEKNMPEKTLRNIHKQSINNH